MQKTGHRQIVELFLIKAHSYTDGNGKNRYGNTMSVLIILIILNIKKIHFQGLSVFQFLHHFFCKRDTGCIVIFIQ